MDAKSNTNFNNSAAGGQLVFCSACGAQNTPDCRFCTSCGNRLVILPEAPATPVTPAASDGSAAPVRSSAPAFQTVSDESFDTGEKPVSDAVTPVSSAASAFQPMTEEPFSAVEEPESELDIPATPASPVSSTAPVFQRVAGGLFGAAEDPDTPVVSDAPAGSAAPAFQSVDEETSGVAHKPEHHSEGEKIEKYIEPASVFADGLPPWDIVPPQVMVRRRRKK